MKTFETIEHAQIEFFYFDNQGTTWYNRLNHSLYEHLQDTIDLEGILKTKCNLQHLTRNFRIKNLDDFERDEADV